MIELLGVKVNEHGEPLWVPDNREAQLVFYHLFFESEVGQQLQPYVSAERDAPMMARILHIHRKWHGEDAEVTLDSFTNVVQSLLTTRDPAIVPPQPVVELEPEIPRDKNGKILSPSQLAWKEHGEYAQANSVKDCRARAQTDASFKKFMESSYRLEMQKKIDGAVIDTRPEPTTKVTSQLREFAAIYMRTPADQVRGLMSPVINPAGYVEYRKNVNDAAEANLI
jgi:hypothetical protein